MYVGGSTSHRVQKFDNNGTFLTKWGKNGGDGSFGSGDGEFFCPNGVTTDADGNVYVADSCNHRVQKFTGAGMFLTKWGSSGTGSGEVRLATRRGRRRR